MAILKFQTPACGQCRMVEQVLKKNNVPFKDVDCTSEEGEELAGKYNVHHVPTVIVVNEDGSEVTRYCNLPAILDFITHYNK